MGRRWHCDVGDEVRESGGVKEADDAVQNAMDAEVGRKGMREAGRK